MVDLPLNLLWSSAAAESCQLRDTVYLSLVQAKKLQGVKNLGNKHGRTKTLPNIGNLAKQQSLFSSWLMTSVFRSFP